MSGRCLRNHEEAVFQAGPRLRALDRTVPHSFSRGSHNSGPIAGTHSGDGVLVDCGLNDVVERTIVLNVRPGGILTLNMTTVSPDELGAQLDKIFRSRREKVVYINADRDVPFQAVAGIIGIAKQHADYVGIVTPSLEKELNCHLGIPMIHRPAPTLGQLGGWR